MSRKSKAVKVSPMVPLVALECPKCGFWDTSQKASKCPTCGGELLKVYPGS